MKLIHIELKKLEIPFCVSFKHASAERTTTEAVIAIVHSDADITGYGEGCPRSYVTGENIESCMLFLEKHHNDILPINNINLLKTFVTDYKDTIDKNPSAWCAIETAILDAFGKAEGKSIDAVVGLSELDGEFKYTAVLGVSNPKVFQAQLTQYIQIGFNDFKVKISGDSYVDKENINAIHAAIPSAKIRLDANNLWNNVDEASHYLSTISSNFWAVEEPIKVRDYTGLQNLANRLQCKIILDESFLRLEDFSFISSNTDIFIPNIRISKMGGLLRSLAIAEECKKRGMKFIIGAQVGETSILTRAALSLANSYRDCLIAQEGAYGTYLLERDITDNVIMFGKGGVYKNILHKEGLGIIVDYFADM